MNVIVRLYWQHDLDLISLALHPDFPLGIWMKKAMIAYARGEKLTIPLPPPQPYNVDVDNMATHFVLNPNKDQDVIAALNGFRTGYRNSAIKTIFRFYLSAPRLDPFYNDETYRVKSRRKKRKSSISSSQSDSKTIKAPKEQIPKKNKKAATVKQEKESYRAHSIWEDEPTEEQINSVQESTESQRENQIPESHDPVPVQKPPEKETEPVEDNKEETGMDQNGGFDLFGAISNMAANTR